MANAQRTIAERKFKLGLVSYKVELLNVSDRKRG